MTNEASRSEIFEHYANHCAQFNPSDASAAFPDYDLNLRPLLPANRDAAILDLGCGMGQFLAYLKARGYQRVTGIDLSRSQIDYCHAQGLLNAQLVDDSIAFLAGQQQQFAAIVAIDVIEHIPKATLIPLAPGDLRRAQARRHIYHARPQHRRRHRALDALYGHHPRAFL
jgi:2-polyprenyl-3-methyl-5-hydroxy-6-metoxy-1,4-benzoquinol methylase